MRVIYRWRVQPENFDAFKQAWQETTNYIHSTVSGAQGSFMLRDSEDEVIVLTVAKRDDFAAWQNFFQGENPPQMQKMRTLGERLSVKAYEEVDDYTK